jgi:hypothetical protein
MNGQPFKHPWRFILLATILLGIAVVHTFLTSYFQKKAHQYPEGSMQENFFHFMGEVEVVFGLWAAILILFFNRHHSAGTDTLAFVDGKSILLNLFLYLRS